MPVAVAMCSDTYDEAIATVNDAIRLHSEDRVTSGEEIPEVTISLLCRVRGLTKVP